MAFTNSTRHGRRSAPHTPASMVTAVGCQLHPQLFPLYRCSAQPAGMSRRAWSLMAAEPVDRARPQDATPQGSHALRADRSTAQRNILTCTACGRNSPAVRAGLVRGSCTLRHDHAGSWPRGASAMCSRTCRRCRARPSIPRMPFRAWERALDRSAMSAEVRVGFSGVMRGSRCGGGGRREHRGQAEEVLRRSPGASAC